MRESEFSPDDVAMMLESRRRESVPRNAYGVPLHEAMDPANQFAFDVVGPRMDFSAAKVHKTQAAYREKNKDADMSALHWAVERN